MKDMLRQPDGKIRTACQFCRQRKKKCSGGMPCAACVSFNRDCCVYDRWTPPTSSFSKESNKFDSTTWAHRSTPSMRHTPLCFTTKVVLKQVQGHGQCKSKHSFQPEETFDTPFLARSTQNTSSPSSQYSLTTSSQYHDMSRTASVPSFDEAQGPLLGSPFRPSNQMSRTISLPALDASSWSQSSTPPSLASPVSPAEELTTMLGQPWFHSPLQQPIFLPEYELQEKDTFRLLQSVDALLEQLGGIPTVV